MSVSKPASEPVSKPASKPAFESGSAPKAVLWDMDGTLVDTEPYWITAEHDLIASHGGTWSHEQALQLVGNDLLTSGRVIKEQTGIALEPAAIVEALLDRVVAQMAEVVPWRAGARELLADLAANEVPCALVTMSYQRFVAPVLEALPPHTFATVVTGDTVSRGKPHPEPYLAAARMLGVDPADSVAIEDSPTGATSAAAAGCRVLVVPNHVEVPAREEWHISRTLPTSLTALTGALRADR